MSSVQHLREFISQRLTAAAEEIFSEFEKTIVQYEEEIDRQRGLLDISWKPQIKLHTAELPQHYVCNEEEVLTDRQLRNQERNFSLDQEEPELPQVKEEQEEVFTGLEGGQLVLTLETDNFMVTSTIEESDHSGPKPNSDQLLSHNSPVPQSPDQDKSKYLDSGSARHGELRPNRHRWNKNDFNNGTNSVISDCYADIDAGRKSTKWDVCGQSFQIESQTKKHLIIHADEKPLSHKTNGGGFGQSGSLTAPYTGEKTFPCSTCGKQFTEKKKLSRHSRSHTGERPYSCRCCGKSFRQSAHLTAHMRIHTGEKPYSCNTCGKRFKDSRTQKRHMGSHNAEKPYCCQICGERFKRGDNMLVHMRTHKV